MAVRKQRATTSTLYAMEKEYKDVLSKAKKIHRYDGEFYIYKRNELYQSVSKFDFQTFNYPENECEHWIIENRRWKKVNGVDIQESIPFILSMKFTFHTGYQSADSR